MDKNSEGLCLFIACTDEVRSRYFEQVHGAFRERTPDTNILDLKRLETREELVQFIKDYLDSARIVSTEDQSEEKQVEPFEREAIDEIFAKSNGIARGIVRLCSKSIEVGIDENLEKIGTEIIRRLSG